MSSKEKLECILLLLSFAGACGLTEKLHKEEIVDEVMAITAKSAVVKLWEKNLIKISQEYLDESPTNFDLTETDATLTEKGEKVFQKLSEYFDKL